MINTVNIIYSMRKIYTVRFNRIDRMTHIVLFI